VGQRKGHDPLGTTQKGRLRGVTSAHCDFPTGARLRRPRAEVAVVNDKCIGELRTIELGPTSASAWEVLRCNRQDTVGCQSLRTSIGKHRQV